MLDNAEKLMWKYMLTHGSVVEQHSYYGTTTDYYRAEECRKLVEEVGIDFEKTKAVRNEDDYEFNGTDEPSTKITYYAGVLMMNDGSEWEWYLDYYEPINILELIKDILPDPFAK